MNTSKQTLNKPTLELQDRCITSEAPLRQIRMAQFKSKIVFILLLFFLGGCATYQGVGSGYWHKNRLAEIETAYQNKELTDAEYLSLKNEADKVRKESAWERHQYNCPYPRYRHSYHFGHYYHH